MQPHIAIVGGGITGLSAAWFCQDQTEPLSYTLLEAGDRWGGKILTEKIAADDGADFIVEGGPDSFLTQKPWAWQLAQKLDLDDEFLPTNDDRRQTFVWNRKRLTALPDGLMLIVPTEFTPFALSPLISPWGKLRMGLDLFIPGRKDDADESLADFMTRRLGREALDKIGEPLLSGIYNSSAEKQSMLATFPRLRAVEAKYGSLVKGMLAAKKQHQAPPAGRRPASMFISFKDGMSTLVERIRDELTGDCRLNTGVTAIQADGAGYLLTLDDGQILRADAVILAVPAYIAADLVESLAPAAAGRLRAIRYVNTGTISLAYRAREVEHALDGFGIVIPRSAGRQVNAVTWSSTKFDRRAPDGHVLIRAFFGGSRTPAMMDHDDEELRAVVRRELAELMGVRAEPLFHKIYRWWQSTPQYDVGHLDQVAAIESALPDGLFVSGSPYRGIGVPDCVRQAEETVNAVSAQLARRQPAAALTNQ